MAGTVNLPDALILSGNVAAHWKTFKQNFEIYIIASGNDNKPDNIKIALLLNIIGQEGVDLYNTFNLNNEEKTKYDKVIQTFEQHTTPKKNEAFDRYIFNQRCQAEGETIDHFVTDLKRLAKSCSFGDLEESLIRDRIIVGISSTTLRESLLRIEDSTLQQVVNHCQASERSREQATQMQQGQGRTKQTGGEETTSIPVDAVARGKYNPKRTIRTTMQQDSQKQHVHERARYYEQPKHLQSISNCSYCGRKHPPRQCPAYGKKCSACQKYNHFAAMCRTEQQIHEISTNEHYSEKNNDSEEDVAFMYGIVAKQEKEIDSLRAKPTKEWRQDVWVENKKINFKLDTGAAVNTIPSEIFDQIRPEVKIKQTNITLEAFGGSTIKPEGTVTLKCEVKGRKVDLKFVVVNLQTTPLLGLEGCEQLELVKKVQSIVAEPTDSIKREFVKNNSKIFQGLGKFPGIYTIKIRKEAKLINEPPHRIPSSMKPTFKRTLETMEKRKVIERVENPTLEHCINQLVTVEKRNGELRFCLDPQELNKIIVSEHHLIPTVSEVAETLAFNEYFTVLDLKDGYHQIELDEK
ncbi:uncharacterized protein LOC134529224 isoform X1 [Bacillus rossius redtenbacheri]|uniref:uncharacterized protein LOC134529224 isoform X1 n=1 Tax=Bacillus rossius redtenbacheri TaxID=93214 RepID=UPI002FDDE1E4